MVHTLIMSRNIYNENALEQYLTMVGGRIKKVDAERLPNTDLAHLVGVLVGWGPG